MACSVCTEVAAFTGNQETSCTSQRLLDRAEAGRGIHLGRCLGLYGPLHPVRLSVDHNTVLATPLASYVTLSHLMLL